jgi:hypothetical protein
LKTQAASRLKNWLGDAVLVPVRCFRDLTVAAELIWKIIVVNSRGIVGSSTASSIRIAISASPNAHLTDFLRVGVVEHVVVLWVEIHQLKTRINFES